MSTLENACVHAMRVCIRDCLCFPCVVRFFLVSLSFCPRLLPFAEGERDRSCHVGRRVVRWKRPPPNSPASPRRPACGRLSTMAALLLALSPASLLPSSQPPAPAYRTLSRRAALLPLLAAPAAVSALPNPFANPEEDKRKAEKEAADKQRSADKQAMYVKVRKERMAAEARQQVESANNLDRAS